MMMNTRVEKQIGVYEPGTPSNVAPDYFESEGEAKRLVNNGEANRINHNKAIRRLYSSKEEIAPKPPEQHGASCKPGPNLIERQAVEAISGRSGTAMVIAAAWIGPVALKKAAVA